MLPDNKCKRRKILKSEEVRQYEYSERNKYSVEERLRIAGYRKPEEYRDCVSHLAW
jgi:hypothetical protein